jgi:hypothetical protein
MQAITLIEISINVSINDLYPSHGAVWFLDTAQDYAGSVNADYEPENFSFRVEDKIYQEVFSYSDVVSSRSSFFVDGTKFYIHFENDHKPYFYESDSIFFGTLKGFSKHNTEWSEILDGQPYSGRVLSAPQLTYKKDNDFNGLQVFTDVGFTIDNADRQYDLFTIQNILFGNPFRIYTWSGDFTLEYQGRLTKTNEGDIISFSGQDLRRGLDKAVSTNSFTYNEKTIILNKPFGRVSKMKLIPLNIDINKGKTSGFSDYVFIVCDATYRKIAADSISAVYIDEVEQDIPLPTISLDLTNGWQYITLSNELFRVVDDSANIKFVLMDKVSVDCAGYLDDSAALIDTGMKTIRWILNDVYNYGFTSSFFDTATWASIEDGIYDYQIGIVITIQTVWEVIEEISLSLLGKFIYGADLKFSWKVIKQDPPIEIITYEQITWNRNISRDPSKVAGIIRVEYNKNNFTGEYKINDDSSFRTAALVLYNSDQIKTLTTALIDDSEVSEYSARIGYFVTISEDITSFSTPEWGLRYIRDSDYIYVDLNYGQNGTEIPYLERCLCECIDIALDTNKLLVRFTVRIIKRLRKLYIITNDEKNIITNAGAKLIKYEEIT